MVAAVHRQAAWIYCLTIQVLPRIWPSTAGLGRTQWATRWSGAGRFGAGVWDGACLGVQPTAAGQCQWTLSKSHHHQRPSIVHQMVSMAWLMLMQMQQLVSGFSASSQRSNYFFWLFGFTGKKKNMKVDRSLSKTSYIQCLFYLFNFRTTYSSYREISTHYRRRRKIWWMHWMWPRHRLLVASKISFTWF